VLPVLITYVPGTTVSTLAGASASGTKDGTGAAAQFNDPAGVALDTNGNLVVADYLNNLVRLVTPAGVVTTLASATNFVDPFAVTVSSDGKYYVQTDADPTGTKDATSGTIWLVTPVSGGVAAPTVVAQGLWRPRGLAPMTGGNLFVVDRTQFIVDELTPAGQATLIAGSSGVAGYVDGTGASAKFNGAVGAAVMPDGSFVVPDAGNNRIRRVTTGGVVTTFAGNGSPTLVDGTCAASSFNAPRGVAADAAGNVYVSDIGDHVIRRIGTDCTVETVAGTTTAGFNDGPGNTALFYGQEGIAVTADGKTLYVSDGNGGDGSAYNRLRVITIP
jgi:sugar lactone lactonase YvrE